MYVFLIWSHPICCYVREIADCSFNVNSNGQCISQNYVLDEQIFINIWKLWIVGNALKKIYLGKGSHLDPPNIYTMVTPLPSHPACTTTEQQWRSSYCLSLSIYVFTRWNCRSTIILLWKIMLGETFHSRCVCHINSADIPYHSNRSVSKIRCPLKRSHLGTYICLCSHLGVFSWLWWKRGLIVVTCSYIYSLCFFFIKYFFI